MIAKAASLENGLKYFLLGVYTKELTTLLLYGTKWACTLGARLYSVDSCVTLNRVGAPPKKLRDNR